jgi:error-prone DNA polymerase
MPFVELRAHTAFSFGDGSVTPEQLARRAAALGYAALGITDTADLGGVPRFALEAKTNGVRPIIGAELRVNGRPAAFLARTDEGYRNLAALVTQARMGSWREWEQVAAGKRRGYPGVTWEQVVTRSAGLHALTGPASGPLAKLVRDGNDDAAARLLVEWRAVFGERLSVEVQLHHVDGSEAALAGALIALAERARVPWVMTQDPRYVNDASRLIHDMLTALRHDMDIDTAARRGLLHPNGEWRLLSPGEIAQRWQGREAGIYESERIAAACNFDLSWMRPPLPAFPVPNDCRDTNVHLRSLVMEGARERWGATISAAQMAQLDHELEIIAQLGFAGFFLVMWDAVRFSRSRGILCQGRGSAANSAVAYCLGITAVDPVKHGLLFERFLSEVRVDGKAEAPDIDVDFEHDRREDVLDYMYATYQRPHAAITCTVQTYRAPNAILDAMRALGYPPEQATSISKRVHRFDPEEGARRVEQTYAQKSGLNLDDQRGRALLAAIAAFEGLPRLRSTHVGGFVLSAAPLGDYLPIEQTTMGRTIVQFDKDDLDTIGVPKFDFLGLGGLALVRRAFDVIERRTGHRPQMYALPTDDAETYEMIARGDTLGTFQIESRAQISSIVHTRPEKLYDIVVQVALIRPGPIQARFVRPYTRRRRGQEPVKYYDEGLRPKLDPILARTQGIPIFQEQAMAIAMAVAGYTGSEADELRRTMGNIRKQTRLMGALDRLHRRMIAVGIVPDVAKQICEDLQSFANYGFPESHAWSFALIAYATAYLKAHHPAEFYMGLLNAWPMGFYSPATLIHDARRHGLEVRPPCMRDGDWECTVEETADVNRPALRIGWRHIRGIGTKALERLQAAHAPGPFTSIADVVRRAALHRADALFLAASGAFGAWESDRHRAAWEALRVVGDTLPLAPAHHTPYEPAPLDRKELTFLDYSTTGISINGHPVQFIRERLQSLGAVDSRALETIDNGRQVIVGGLVTVRQRPETANGTIFLLVEDEYGFINIVVSHHLVDDNEDVVKTAPFIVVKGRLEREGPAINVVGQKFRALEAGEIAHHSRDFH